MRSKRQGGLPCLHSTWAEYAKRVPWPNSTPCGACPVRTLTVCAALEADELRRLADIVQMQRVEANQTIFAEGEGADALFNVTAGTVKLYKLLPDGRRQITGFLVTGDFLGLAMNENYAYSAGNGNPDIALSVPPP